MYIINADNLGCVKGKLLDLTHGVRNLKPPRRKYFFTKVIAFAVWLPIYELLLFLLANDCPLNNTCHHSHLNS